MKISIFKLIIAFIVTATSVTAVSQNPFLGTWEYVEGDLVFQVTLYDNPNSQDLNRLYGDYKMLERINGMETLIYRSNYEYEAPFNLGTKNEGAKIFGGKVANKFSGRVIDNSIDHLLGWQNRKSIEGFLLLELLPIDIACRDCPQRISWKINKPIGLWTGTASDYNIPRDIVLIKVN